MAVEILKKKSMGVEIQRKSKAVVILKKSMGSEI